MVKHDGGSIMLWGSFCPVGTKNKNKPPALFLHMVAFLTFLIIGMYLINKAVLTDMYQ